MLNYNVKKLEKKDFFQHFYKKAKDLKNYFIFQLRIKLFNVISYKLKKERKTAIIFFSFYF